MTERELQKLIDQYLKGQCTQKEEAVLDSLFDSYRKSQRKCPPPVDYEGLREEMLQNIKSEIRKKKKSFYSFPYRIVASIILILGIALYLNHHAEPEWSDITKSTEKGQKATVILSDGSTVRLNAMSSIRFPETFPEDSREIELNGEAFFTVKKDPERPFIVRSHTIETIALGTSFNINAYDTASVSVALVTGKVKIKAVDGAFKFNKSAVYLSPGESAFYDEGSGDINITPFDSNKLIAWKDEIIYYEKATHVDVFKQLARWYGVEFSFVNEPTEEWDVSGEFKGMSLELVLNTIRFTKGFDFQIQNDVVTVEFKN